MTQFLTWNKNLESRATETSNSGALTLILNPKHCSSSLALPLSMQTKYKRRKKKLHKTNLGVPTINTGIKYFPQIFIKLQNLIWYAYENTEETLQGKGNASTSFHYVDVEDKFLLALKRLMRFLANK